MTSKDFCKIISSFVLYLNCNNIHNITATEIEEYFKSIQYLAIKEMIKDDN